MSRYNRETVVQRIGHIFDTNIFLMLMLCVSYIMCFKYMIEDEVAKNNFVSKFTMILYITTFISFIYATYQSVNVLRLNHPKMIKPFVLLFLLFLSFFSIYFATYEVYFRGGYASNYFMIFVELMMKLFSMLFFSIAISLTSYAYLLKSKKDMIKMIIMMILSLCLFVELYILAMHSTVTTYVSKIEILAVYFFSISFFNLIKMLRKNKEYKLMNIDTIIGLVSFIILIAIIYMRDYQKIMNFFYDNIFRNTYDLILHYTLMIVLQFIFMILIIKNYKVKCYEKK